MPKFNEFCCAIKCISKELLSELEKENESVSNEDHGFFHHSSSTVDLKLFQKKLDTPSSAINRISQLVFTSKLIKGKSSFFDSSFKKDEMNLIRANIYKVKKKKNISLIFVLPKSFF